MRQGVAGSQGLSSMLGLPVMTGLVLLKPATPKPATARPAVADYAMAISARATGGIFREMLGGKGKRRDKTGEAFVKHLQEETSA